MDELLITQPDTGEQALEIVDAPVRSGAVHHRGQLGCRLGAESELEGDMGDTQWALRPA